MINKSSMIVFIICSQFTFLLFLVECTTYQNNVMIMILFSLYTYLEISQIVTFFIQTTKVQQ